MRPQKIEPENWALESTTEHDKKLPKPRGVIQPKKAIDPEEEFRLEITRVNGGLVKERWFWPSTGRPVFDAYVVHKKDEPKPHQP